MRELKCLGGHAIASATREITKDHAIATGNKMNFTQDHAIAPGDTKKREKKKKEK